ncbi:MAG: hypothetical protein GF364_21565 [Candidatus Lokiarchaeota archaeon]|nr:hypothetical protein [Candidatus Lokiarchaeota archaeon]
MSSRLSAAVGEVVPLQAKFLDNGQPSDPYVLCSIKIYSQCVCDENLVTEIILPEPTDYDRNINNSPIYNDLIRRCRVGQDSGECGTDYSDIYTPGCFVFDLELCKDVFSSGVYHDVWCFIGNESELSSCTTNPTSYEQSDCQCQCNTFYVQESQWFVDDGLKNIRLGFEPLDRRFQQPEKRTLEVGITPLPLYDYDRNKIAPLIPRLSATISVFTQYGTCETIIDSEEMRIGLRQGSYRSNPYVLQYLLDTSRFIKGTYRYRVDVSLPNGETRSSPFFNLTIR